MDSFNLIPNEYREAQTKRRTLINLGIACCALLAVCSITLSAAEGFVVEMEDEADQLRLKKAVSTREQARMTELTKQRKTLEGQSLLLDSLRSGAPVSQLIQTIEQAVTATEVRFVSWHFRRSGIVVKDDPEVRAPSYFVIAKTADEFPREWHALTHMTIHGTAQDHAALSKFVQRLFRHPTVEDVKVQRSTQQDDGVKFNLAVMVKTQGSIS